MKKTVEHIKKLLEKTHPLPWKNSSGNIPFYIDLVKPRSSLSKHDSKRPTYWHYDDAAYVLACIHEMPLLLTYIEELESKISTFNKNNTLDL